MTGDEQVSPYRHPAADDIDRRALVAIAETGLVDSGRLVQIAQLMLMPEFDRFFAALCELDMARAPHVAQSLASRAEDHARPPVGDLAEFIDELMAPAGNLPNPETP